VSWKAYHTPASMSLVYRNARLDEIPNTDPHLYHYNCGHGHDETVGGSFLKESVAAIKKLLADNVLLSLETDDQDAIQMVWSTQGMPISAVVLRNPDDTYQIALRTSYQVPPEQINQALADMALLAEVEHDMEGVIRKAVDAALEMEQRVIDLFRMMEELHCDAPSQ
jgi:hypothetical protein